MESSTIETLDVLRSQSEADYKAAVFSAARGGEGEEIDTESLRTTLWPIGKTLDDFEADVARARDRIDQAQRLQQADALASDVADAKAARDEAAKKLQAAEEEARHIVENAHAAWQTAETAHVQLVRQQRELRRTADNLARSADPEIGKAIEQLDFQRSGLGARVQAGREAAAVIKRDQEKIGRLREMKTAGGTWPAPSPGDLDIEIGQIEAAAAGPRDRAERGAAAAAEIVTIDAEIEGLRQHQLDPEGGMQW